MKLTKEKTIEEHRKMWNWIADEILKQNRKIEKWEYFDYAGIPIEEISNECFCCEFMKQHGYSIEGCRFCPIIWDTKKCYGSKCFHEDSLYTKYVYSNAYENSYEEISNIARDIANLPERMD